MSYKQQSAAIERFRRFLQQDIERYAEKYGAAITKFEVKDYGSKYISAETELVGLQSGNLLRALDHTFWLAVVGKCGAITVLMAPKSFKQFHGRRAFNMNWKVKS